MEALESEKKIRQLLRVKKRKLVRGSRDQRIVIDREISNVNNKIREVKAAISPWRVSLLTVMMQQKWHVDIATRLVMGNRFRKSAKEQKKVLQELENTLENLNETRDVI